MPSIEYKCSQCHEVFWHELDYDEEIPPSLRHYCYAVEGYWTMMRRDLIVQDNQPTSSAVRHKMEDDIYLPVEP